MAAAIDVIGLGVAEQALLSPPARTALAQAAVVIGSPRQLATVSQQLHRAQLQLPLPPLRELSTLLSEHRNRTIALLASGDPLHYGIGSWLSRHADNRPLRFHPAVSSIQAACHELGLALQEVNVLSLHGRPLATLRRALRRNRKLAILTDRHSGPDVLAAECAAAGFGSSQLWVCERLGYADQRIRTFSVDALRNGPPPQVDPLHVTVIALRGRGGVQPEFPGIPDHHYQTGSAPGQGMITKREVRLTLLSLLQPAAGDVIWDIGAGCGGVAVELALWNRHVTVHAIEQHPERLRHLQANREHFGVVDNLHIHAGRAPACLDALPAPNKIFIGGSDGELPHLLEIGWQQLSGGGRLAATAVTEASTNTLQQFARQRADARIESLQLAVSKGVATAANFDYHAKLPVTLFAFSKHKDSSRHAG